MSIGKFLLVRGLSTLKGKALETWDTVKNELKELVEKIETGVEKIEGFASRTMERLRDFVTFRDEMHSFAKDIGQEEAVETDYAFDGTGFDIPERAEAFSILNAIKAKSWKAARSIGEWLMKLEPHRLKEVVKSGILSKIIELQGKVLDDVGEAWRLNKNVDDFKGLLKGLSFTPDYPAQGKFFYELLHECVESRSLERLRFLERGYGWIAEVREMELEPGQKPATIVENSFPFIRDVLNTLDGDCLRKISDILDNLLESRGKKGAYDAMLDLKRHLFDVKNIGLGKEEPKIWLVEECLEKWEEASRLSDAVVSHQTFDARGHYRARSPVEVNYLDAENSKVIPIIAEEEGEGGFGITIPEDAAEYLGLREEGFVILFKNIPQGAKEIVPVKVDSRGQITLTEWFKKVFGKKAEYAKYFHLEGETRINWNSLENDYMLLEIKVSKDGSEITRMFAFIPREQEIIRVRVGELTKEKDIVECMLRLMKAGDFLKEEYGVSEKVAQDIVRDTYEVMQYETKEGLEEVIKDLPKLARNNLIGKWGEWKAFQIICKYKEIFGEIVSYQARYNNKKLDFVTTKCLIEVKNWEWSIWDPSYKDINTVDLIDELENGYKPAYGDLNSEYYHKKVILLFYEELPEDGISFVTSMLKEKFGEFESWLKILNGVYDIIKFTKVG